MVDPKDDAEQKGDLSRVEDTPKSPERPPKQDLYEFAATIFQQGAGQAVNPEIAKRVTSEHIDKILDQQSELNNLQLDNLDGQRRQVLHLTYVVAAALLILVSLLVFTGNESLTEQVVEAVVYVLAGGLGGYGLGKRSS